jgi:hypothetical protein
MNRSLPRAAAVALLATLVLGLPAVGARATGIDGDDANDRYIASGSVLLGDTFVGDPGVRERAARCPGCQWRLATVCRPSSVDQGETCGAAYAGCPAGSYRMRVARWSTAEPWWQWVGLVCVGPGVGPVPIDAVAGVLRKQVVQLVPPARPRLEPSGTTLANLPTVAMAGQPRVLGPLDLVVLGQAVRLEAEATWTWAWGDGGSLATTDPGRPWPAATVLHTYRLAGLHRVVLTTTWSARFTVGGLGPFDVAGPPVTQTAGLPLRVRQALARLVR